MTIVTATEEDAEQIAVVVSEANKDVAELFNINRGNNPKHPSFYTIDWVLSDMKRGEEYFLYAIDENVTGCVAFEQPDADTAFLNRLCVLPKYRNKGIGESLVNHINGYAKSKNVRIVSIGIIATHDVLKAWYKKLGFIEKQTQRFEHLPFDVAYMNYEL